jgi:Zn-dependent M16 (insulinase) family peptidase
MEINEVKYGFKLISVEKMEDINSTLYQYEHLKSGGKVAYLANDDTNCCFAIGFRTLPEDSTGVCHIIEHSVLCGSKRFPLKEPFVNLIKSSLATFLNAFTAYDWTMYPFSSQTPKDFHNILEIYLDAVFNPISMENEKPFLQEGWHLELNSVDDTPSYKGVVYNEMKGAMSSVDEVLVQATLEAMYKDTFYRFNSGGDPDVIPTLTYQAYKDFYHRHYTPQNAMTYFYGDLDIEEKLKFLDEEYFSKFDKVEDEIVIVPQSEFVDTSFTKEYEIGPDEDEKDNTYMSLCYGLDHYNNYEDFLAMNILTDALLSKNDSVLKKALLDASLGQNVECRIDDDNIIPALHIYLQKSNPENKEKFKEVFETAVKELVENGIDKELLLASINHMEFKDKELDVGGMPKGLLFAMTMMGSFNYNGDLKAHLEFSKYYEKFKKELKLFLLAVLVFPVIALMLMFVVPMWYLEFKYPDFEDDYTNKIINTDTSNLSASPNLLSNTGISPFR